MLYIQHTKIFYGRRVCLFRISELHKMLPKYTKKTSKGLENFRTLYITKVGSIDEKTTQCMSL